MTPDPITNSSGLSPRTAALLAYSGWWATGLLFWWFERHDASVRFHAAQATVTFGLVVLLMGAFVGLALASLSFLPTAFALFMGAAAATWALGVVLWLVVMWKTASGHTWRIPLAADLADRMV